MKQDNQIPRPPIGELFSRVYMSQGQPTHESETLRRRVGAYVQYDLFEDHWKLSIYLRKESGQGPRQQTAGNTLYHRYEEFFEQLHRDEFMNAITLVWRYLWTKHKTYQRGSQGYKIELSPPANAWREFIARVFKEENVGYTVDEKCGVRFTVDTHFELQRTSVLQCLGVKRYNAVAAAFEDAHRYFSTTPADLKAAVRSMFESVEILAKLMVRTDRLTAKLVLNDIKALVLKAYSGDAVAQRARGRTIEGFADWVDGLHHYRHGQGDEDPVAPPEDFAVYALSSGAAFLRWLVQVDTSLKSANDG